MVMYAVCAELKRFSLDIPNNFMKVGKRDSGVRLYCTNAPHHMLDIWLPLLKGAHLRLLP